MTTYLRPAIVFLATFTLLTGVLYPLLVTGVARLAFPHQADGSFLMRDATPVGSTLIGQSFTSPRYFWGRLSATSPTPYNAGSSSGSNFGPLNPDLLHAASDRAHALRAADPGNAAPIPVDLVTASASGLDPHISPAAAQYQIRRVARARGMTEAAVRALVAQHTEGRQGGVFGEARVNVLELNLALDGVR